jgi:hypothetical protein
VRVWLRADDNPERVGHLAQIAKSHPDKGMHAKLVTTAVTDAHWLPLDRKGVLWDWLPNLRVRTHALSLPHVHLRRRSLPAPTGHTAR